MGGHRRERERGRERIVNEICNMDNSQSLEPNNRNNNSKLQTIINKRLDDTHGMH